MKNWRKGFIPKKPVMMAVDYKIISHFAQRPECQNTNTWETVGYLQKLEQATMSRQQETPG